ncbi:MAG: radical SAM protein, partial [Pseudomonas protegens]
DMQFLPRQRILTLEELYQLAERFVALGTRKIRLTGGEPLIRPGVVQLCRDIARLPGLRELCMTTNGSQLGKLAAPLFDAGVKRLNISLDSLDPTLFRQLTRTGE